jgi:hypothetical protein
LPPDFLGPSSSLIHSDHVRHLPRPNFVYPKVAKRQQQSQQGKRNSAAKQHLNKNYEKNFYHFIQKQWQPVSESIQT